ncbi:MAG: Fic family protein [Flavobacteriales bacterium]|nr:Fic family protein [Flavobacteriales bacterium]
MPRYVHELPDWPAFRWDAKALAPALAKAHALQGHLLGRMAAVGFDLRTEANFQTMATDVLRTSEIEGEVLDPAQVRSSLARRLGLDVSGTPKVDRHVDGVVEMLLDATQRCHEKLTVDRLLGWHAALFPTGRSGMLKVLVGQWRDDPTGPMQVVSGPMGRERVHYEAPGAKRLKKEMTAFLKWVNTGSRPVAGAKDALDPLLKAGLGHFWFVTLHPFEDGNGRMARAVADLLLARADGSPQRFYSMSAQVRNERKRYYDVLERSQRGTLDVTEWLAWFLACLQRALVASEETLSAVLGKHKFWQTHAKTILNPRQVKVLNKLLDGFEGNLTSSKYAKLTKSSQDTASRDLTDLVAKKVLKKGKAGGRSTHFVLA